MIVMRGVDNHLVTEFGVAAWYQAQDIRGFDPVEAHGHANRRCDTKWHRFKITVISSLPKRVEIPAGHLNEVPRGVFCNPGFNL